MKAKAHTYKYNKNQESTMSQKENDISPETKVIEYWNLTGKEFKLAVMKKFNKL